MTHGLARFVPCDLNIGTTCLERFIQAFGRRAIRRPVPSELVTQLKAVYALGAQYGGTISGAKLVMTALLGSPEFLYLVERPAGSTGESLDAFETASRLSYFLWQSMPDEALLAAAEAGELSSSAGIRAQAKRLLTSNKSKNAIDRFTSEWLSLDGVERLRRNPTLFPKFTASLPEDMRQETLSFADYVIRKGDGTLNELLTAPYSFPRGGLFNLYGMTAPAGYTGTTPLQMPEARRGILTQASYLAMTSHETNTSVVRRGVVLLNNVLCSEIDFPTDLEVPPLPEPDPAKTTRERFAQHESNPVCGRCHKAIDPLGFSFEGYDALGERRTTENGLPIDETATVALNEPSLDGFVGSVRELAPKLANSPQVHGCFARQWYRFALGRMEMPADACTLASMKERLAASGGNIRELLLDLVTQDSFRLRWPQ
jgi:hypothetical protein